MEYIFNEQLQWAVDGVNKTFTTANEIGNIEEVYLWGLPYRDISFSWNIVTFNSAPPLGANQPTIDYFLPSEAPAPAEWQLLFWDIIDDVYEWLDEDRTSDIYKESVVKKKINDYIKKLRNNKFVNEDFLTVTYKTEWAFTAVKDALWIKVNGTEWKTIPSTWFVTTESIGVFEYLWISNEWLLSGTLWKEIKDRENITFAIKKPNWCKKIWEVRLNWTPLSPSDIRKWDFYSSSFTEYWDFIILPYHNEWIISVTYVQNLEDASADTDLISFIPEYAEVISTYVAYKYMIIMDDERWQAVKQEWKEERSRWSNYRVRMAVWANNQIGTSWVLNNWL